jgi:putative transcriptional regulator
MIRWKLNEVMASRRMANRRLAELIGIHENSVSRLKAADKMPRMDGDRLNGICKALQCHPADLLEYVQD